MGREKCLELVLGGTSVKGRPTPRMFYRPVAAGVIPAHPSSGPLQCSSPVDSQYHCQRLSSPLFSTILTFPKALHSFPMALHIKTSISPSRNWALPFYRDLQPKYPTLQSPSRAFQWVSSPCLLPFFACSVLPLAFPPKKRETKKRCEASIRHV